METGSLENSGFKVKHDGVGPSQNPPLPATVAEGFCLMAEQTMLCGSGYLSEANLPGNPMTTRSQDFWSSRF